MGNEKQSTNSTLMKKLLQERTAPKVWFVLLLAIYAATSVILNIAARSTKIVTIGPVTAPLKAFSGVFSSLASISVIFLVVFFRKQGYIPAIILILIQFPIIIAGVVTRRTPSGVSGIFTNILAATAITIIYINGIKVERSQERMNEQAVTDQLTGIPNRFACSEFISMLIRQNEKFAVVSVDINNFKSINDTMGHNTGNKVLKEIASRWRKTAGDPLSGSRDIVCRQGGDEFAILIRGYDSESDIRQKIACYESVLGSKISVNGYDIYVTASFGYAEFPADTHDAELLFSYADSAMYEIKQTKSSTHVLRFSPDMLGKKQTLETEKQLRYALENGTISFALQPQYDISHKLRGFEALARMKDSSGNSVSPGEFIPAAEKAGMIDKVDSAVFRRSAEFFSGLMRKTGLDITLSINISVRHMMKKDFLEEVRTVLSECGLSPHQLELEITESIMIDSPDKAINCISEIKKMGIKIAIDDFGTGYSSLSYLNKFPADLLKIDKSFVDKMNSSDSSKQYVAAIISIGHIMNFDVISEGVEDDEQLATLREIGCDFIQGYIWGRPLPPEEAEELVLSLV